jgi:hypothetical protein
MFLLITNKPNKQLREAQSNSHGKKIGYLLKRKWFGSRGSLGRVSLKGLGLLLSHFAGNTHEYLKVSV